jgi:predicted Zn-dependent protease with MMP-like domain/predicted nucleic acid-binding protein
MSESERTQMDPDRAMDVAWEALEEGDIAGARRAVSQLDAAAPETLLLLAACFREEEDEAKALETLKQAAAADDEWATPELWIAELLAGTPETMEEALRHAERALDLAEEEEEYLSALSLKAGLEAELGEVDEAKRTLADLPPADVALGDVTLALEIAELYLHLGEPVTARERFRTITTTSPDVSDAWYALGCAAAELDDDEERAKAWKRAWQLDTAPAAAPEANHEDEDDDVPHLSDEAVTSMAEQALAELPERARALLRDVPIIIAEWPAEADVDDGLDPRVLGLFTGTAYPDMPHVGGQPGLTQIVLFRRNIENVAESAEELREELRTTLLHETGHFFGLGEAELEGVGLA